MITASSGDASIRRLLSNHPKVSSVTDDGKPGLRFLDQDLVRAVELGTPELPLHGLVEIVDNNPLVCAGEFSVPSPVATAALIGLAPIALAGLLVEPPAIAVNLEEDAELVEGFLRSVGIDGEVALVDSAAEDNPVLSATVLAKIATPEDLDEIDELYEERYGRSFFVRRNEDDEWTEALVKGQPYAVYRLQITVGEPHSLLSISILADREGKCGAAQVVHAMNVMMGFEEPLGL